jgi:hypothetical protein
MTITLPTNYSVTAVNDSEIVIESLASITDNNILINDKRDTKSCSLTGNKIVKMIINREDNFAKEMSFLDNYHGKIVFINGFGPAIPKDTDISIAYRNGFKLFFSKVKKK